MAVVRSDLINQSGSANEDTSRRFEFVYRVQTNDRLDTAVIVTAGFPALFSSLGAMWPGALLVSINPEQDEANPFIWIVTLEYTTLNFAQAGGANTAHSTPSERQENPTARRPVVSWSTQKYQKAATKGTVSIGQSGELGDEVSFEWRPIQNSAGDPYEAVEIDDSRLVLTIQRNETTGQFDPVNLSDFHDTTNSQPFYQFEIGEVKFDSFKATSQHENGVTFWEVTYEFHIRRNYTIEGGGRDPDTGQVTDINAGGWDLVLPDAGYATKPKEEPNAKRVEIMDGDSGNVVSTPQLLNGKGDFAATGEKFWNVWTVYNPKDFAELNLE